MAYKLSEVTKPNFNELSNLEKNLRAENLRDSKKQILCDKMEEQLEKLDEMYTERIRITRPEVRTEEFVDFSDIRCHYRDLIKLYRHSKDCGSQTSLVSSTSAGCKDLNETVIDTRKWSDRNAEENVEVSSRHSATHGSRKQPSTASLRSSERRNRATTAKVAAGIRAGA